MIKLSEIKDNEILIVSNYITDKETYLEKQEEYIGKEVYTTTQYEAYIDAKDMIETALEGEYQNMYEDWYDSIINDVTEEDISDMQKILNRILYRNKSNNITYFEDKKVDIDN